MQVMGDFYRDCAIPKPPRREKAAKPLQRRRTPRTSPVTRERRRSALKRIQAERDVKDEVRERDQSCRWPACSCCYVAWQGWRLIGWAAQEVAHLEHKGMGGDKQLLRTQRQKMILLCKWRHRGPRGIDSKLAKIEPLTKRGTDGLCEFFQIAKDGRWLSVGIG